MNDTEGDAANFEIGSIPFWLLITCDYQEVRWEEMYFCVASGEARSWPGSQWSALAISNKVSREHGLIFPGDSMAARKDLLMPAFSARSFCDNLWHLR